MFKIKSDVEFSGRHDQVTLCVYSQKIKDTMYICVKMMARQRFFVFVSSVLFFFQVLLSLTRNVQIQHKGHNRQLLMLTIVSAKSKI